MFTGASTFVAEAGGQGHAEPFMSLCMPRTNWADEVVVMVSSNCLLPPAHRRPSAAAAAPQPYDAGILLARRSATATNAPAPMRRRRFRSNSSTSDHVRASCAPDRVETRRELVRRQQGQLAAQLIPFCRRCQPRQRRIQRRPCRTISASGAGGPSGRQRRTVQPTRIRRRAQRRSAPSTLPKTLIESVFGFSSSSVCIRVARAFAAERRTCRGSMNWP